MTDLTDRTLALAAVVQSAHWVHRLATTGETSDADLETAIASLFRFSPDSTEDAVGGRLAVNTGLRTLIKLIESGGQDPAPVTRYWVALTHLERKLAKRPDMLGQLAGRLENAERQLQHFDSPTNPSTLANLSQIYQDTLSTFNYRIQVSGDARHLQASGAPDRVRTLLLGGVRASMLWHQVGGRRWHLLLQRPQYLRSAKQLLNA